MAVDVSTVVSSLAANGVSVFAVGSRVLLIYAAVFGIKYAVCMLTGQPFSSGGGRGRGGNYRGGYRSGYYRNNYRGNYNSRRSQNQRYMDKW